MDINTNEDAIFLQCECVANSDHTIRVICDDGIYGDEQIHAPQFVVSAQMSHYKGFWGRLLIAIKYVLGIDNTYCHYTETICSIEQMDRLNKFVQERKEAKWIDINQSRPKDGQKIEGKSPSGAWWETWDDQEPVGTMTHWRPDFSRREPKPDEPEFYSK